ncbi:hypothetical protein [Planctomicrobium sp. SH664]|uniref:hypothetical protein n=1 Tax=Planctomicrobium sp. SH664 TaxID=3448125 RepID=UPI003F5C15D9
MTANSPVRCVLLILLAMAGCQGGTPVDTGEPPLVLVDNKTGEVFVAQQLPAIPAPHPQSGTKTLMPGMYCSRCRVWHVVPPVEVRQHHPEAARCPKSKTPLAMTGPVPDSAQPYP